MSSNPSEPKIWVVDASVVAKWFLSEQESHVAQALDLLSLHLSDRLVIAGPDHLRLEIANAARKRLPFDAIVRVADTLDGLHLDWHRIDGALARSAAELAAKHQISPYDACYCALALMLDTELITDDRRLAASGACKMRLLEDVVVPGE